MQDDLQNDFDLVQFEENGLGKWTNTIVSTGNLQADALPINVGDSVSVKYGKEYIVATILEQDKFTETSRNYLHNIIHKSIYIYIYIYI